jgi:hypothetical protein
MNSINDYVNNSWYNLHIMMILIKFYRSSQTPFLCRAKYSLRYFVLICQQYKGKIFLHIHCNNGYLKASLCCFIPALSNLFFPLRRVKISHPRYTPGIREQIDEGCWSEEQHTFVERKTLLCSLFMPFLRIPFRWKCIQIFSFRSELCVWVNLFKCVITGCLFKAEWNPQKKLCEMNVQIRNVKADGSLWFAVTYETLGNKSFRINMKCEWLSSIALAPTFKNNIKRNNVFFRTNILKTRYTGIKYCE